MADDDDDDDKEGKEEEELEETTTAAPSAAETAGPLDAMILATDVAAAADGDNDEEEEEDCEEGTEGRDEEIDGDGDDGDEEEDEDAGNDVSLLLTGAKSHWLCRGGCALQPATMRLCPPAGCPEPALEAALMQRQYCRAQMLRVRAAALLL